MKYLILAALAAGLLCSCRSRSVEVTFSGDWSTSEKQEFLRSLNSSRYSSGAKWIEEQDENQHDR